MSKENLYHKNAIYFILNNENDYNSKIFENSYVNKVYNDLVLQTKNSYDLINLNESIDKINLSLDKKRTLAKEFKKLTNMPWVL